MWFRDRQPCPRPPVSCLLSVGVPCRVRCCEEAADTAVDAALQPAEGTPGHCAIRWGSFGHLSVNYYFPFKMKISVRAKPLTCRWKWSFNYSFIQPLASEPCVSRRRSPSLPCMLHPKLKPFDTALTISLCPQVPLVLLHFPSSQLLTSPYPKQNCCCYHKINELVFFP